MNPSSFNARVLNAFHDLHASMTTSSLPPAAAAAFFAGAGTSVTALRFAVFLVIAFLGAMARERRGCSFRELLDRGKARDVIFQF